PASEGLDRSPRREHEDLAHRAGMGLRRCPYAHGEWPRQDAAAAKEPAGGLVQAAAVAPHVLAHRRSHLVLPARSDLRAVHLLPVLRAPPHELHAEAGLVR